MVIYTLVRDVIDVMVPFQGHLPFAVVGSMDEVKVGNKMVKARQYPWGIVQGNERMVTWMQHESLGAAWGAPSGVRPALDRGGLSEELAAFGFSQACRGGAEPPCGPHPITMPPQPGVPERSEGRSTGWVV